MPTRHDEAVDLRSLPQFAPGYAYVTGVEVHGETGVLRLRYAHGREVLASFPHATDGFDESDPSLSGRTPLSVIVSNGARLRCHAIAHSAGGARPVPITAHSAWACARRGIHTVLISGGDPA